MTVIWHNSDQWDVSTVPTSPASRRGRRSAIPAQPTGADVPSEFLARGVTVTDVIDATPKATRRGDEVSLVDVSVPIVADERYVLAIRHPSGALTFHAGDQEVARRGVRAAAATAIRFRVTVSDGAPAGQRRGVVSNAIKLVVLKVTEKIADAVVERLVAAWEPRAWKKNGLAEGWFRVSAATLKSGKLVPGVPDAATVAPGRSLLFLHGTFSNAASAYRDLAKTDFFTRVQPVYGDRIYAFNHFSLSKRPEENARDLLAGLPNGPTTFDVITHSRGGLVLRNLVERRDFLGPAAKRFQLGRAILVASPNEGTPLATPKRWEDTVGWFANLVEIFPDNPLTLAAEWVSEAIVWIANRAAGGIPGLAAMTMNGKQINDLQMPPGPPPAAYSALTANYTPDDNVLLRMLDVGVDAFFTSANDLVVPTEGGWHVDKPGAAPAIAAAAIGCFGPGGNFPDITDVHHLNFFGRQQTADFLVRALKGEPQGLPVIDPQAALPERNRRRGVGAPMLAPAAQAALPVDTMPNAAAASVGIAVDPLASSFSDSFQLTILGSDNADGRNVSYQLVASYGGARVVVPFWTADLPRSARVKRSKQLPAAATQDRRPDAGKQFQRIIATNRRIKDYIDGKAKPLDDNELIEFGKVLFDTLFPTNVRRLYDVARSRERGGRLNVIFTSTIPWLADLPWEFAYDPARKTYLTTQELNFVRNVVTLIPADKIEPRPGPLRILVAVAQPVGTGKLSAEEEEAVIRRGFEPLINAGLVTVEVLRGATPNSMHRWISVGNFDVVHFIGHGVFRKPDGGAKQPDQKSARFEQDDAGFLVFEDGRGGSQYVGFRTAREIFCQRGVRLVFLNACESGEGGHGDFNSGVAPALVAGGIPNVVANQYKVLDQSATEFSQHFYWALAQGESLGSATREARIAVNYSIAGENIDWAVPVVYARDPDGSLCERRPVKKDMLITPLVSGFARRAIELHARRIAIWDVNHVFPELDETVEQMNRAQTSFGFTVVEFSAPTGLWRREKDSDLQLNANEAAARLRFKPQELGVDYLYCITDRLIAFAEDGETYENYYNWWSTEDDENVLIFSTDIPKLPVNNLAGRRVIANAMVQGLTGVLAKIEDTHARNPKDCPLYWDPEPDMLLIAKPQHFDKTCTDQVRRKISPADFAALQTLLRLFD